MSRAGFLRPRSGTFQKNFGFHFPLGVSVAAFAHGDHKPSPECQPIADACKAANPTDKKAEHKCFGATMHGKTPDGVTVTADQVTACKATMKGHHKGKKEKTGASE